jgi:hypothetical protein
MEKIKIEIKWGVIFSLVTLLWMVFEKAMGLHDTQIDKHIIYSNFFAVVAIGIYILALRDKKINFFNNEMSWKQGTVTGIYLSFVVCLLSPLVQLFTFTVVSPDFFDNMIQYNVSNKIQTSAQALSYFNMTNYIIQGSFGGLSMGIVSATIISLFIQTKNKNK